MEERYMREIYIKYNPYKVETKILIDGKPVKKNSALNVGDRRLQEWVEELPEILVDECNTKNFKVEFHGTILDYEDLFSVIKKAEKEGFQFECKHIPAKEVKDKEKAIEEIFEEIQQGPFEELKQPDVVKAFKMAQSSEFPVNVVATMSAGKSTLINALLRQKLMPAKQEACTATITELKDNDYANFHAMAYDKDGNLLETHEKLTLEVMTDLNNNPEVSTIQTEGNIPFVDSNDVALVLVDTPGPNNSRDPEHKAATYRMLSESSKTLVLYILNATQLAVNDDNNLLTHVADSMKVGGKQSKDRFIFVVNKLDDFKKGEDSVSGALEKVRKYLEDKGIENPNIYPASALTALNIRTVLKDEKIVGFSEEELDELDPEVMGVITSVRKINRNSDLHLEKYAPLTPSVRGKISAELAKAEEMASDKTADALVRSEGMKQIALIHSGIVPIEAAIQMYVQKYAKTAKIKNIVDTFAKKLESQQSFEKTKREIAENQDKQEEILKDIEAIKEKLKDGNNAKKFEQELNAINYDGQISKIGETTISKAREQIRLQIENSEGKMLKRDAELRYDTYQKFAEQLQAEVQVKLEDLISNFVEKNAMDLLEAYKKRLKDLVNELQIGEIEISPLQLLEGNIAVTHISTLISGSTSVERVKVGKKWVTNTGKKWYKPWTWFQKSGWYEDIVEEREYIDGTQFAQKFFSPIVDQLYDNLDNGKEYAKEQIKFIKVTFASYFKELDKLLEQKLKTLEMCAKDSQNVGEIIKRAQDRLDWLTDIQNKLQNILDI